jgi:hypothetical protein
MKYSKHKNKNGDIRQYYLCNTCNTKRAKQYRKTPTGGAIFRSAAYKSIRKYQYKQNARIILNMAVNSGLLTRPKICSKCKLKGIIEGHHPDYKKPLKVKWWCKKCHCKYHKRLKNIKIK